MMYTTAGIPEDVKREICRLKSAGAPLLSMGAYY